MGNLLDFLTNRHHIVLIGTHTSFTLVLNTGVPQGRVLGPFLSTLCTQDCTPRHQDSSIVRYADNITIISRITNNDESSYKEEI